MINLTNLCSIKIPIKNAPTYNNIFHAPILQTYSPWKVSKFMHSKKIILGNGNTNLRHD
jgi:hypothetical protein